MELAVQSLKEMIETLLGIVPLKCKSNLDSKYHSSISIQDKTYYFSLNDSFLDALAKAFSLTPPLSQEEKKDLTQEFANLIIGKVKVLCHDTSSTLSTPIFLTQLPSHLTQGVHFQIQNGKCSIYKE